MGLLTLLCFQTPKFADEIIQEGWLCLQIECRLAGNLRDGELSKLRLLFGGNVESAWLVEMKSCVECSARILRSELTKSDVEQTSVDVVFEHPEPYRDRGRDAAQPCRERVQRHTSHESGGVPSVPVGNRYLVLAVYRTRIENFVASGVRAVCE